MTDRNSSRRLSRLHQTQRLPQTVPRSDAPAIHDLTIPPTPPLVLTPAVACSPDTDANVLWHIAQHVPELRRWLIANPQADAALLEFVSQVGGPGVKQALEILLESMEDD